MSEPKYKSVNLELGKAILGKEEAFLNLILPDGYEIAGYSMNLLATYIVKEKKSNKKCATVRFYYSNGMTLGFDVDGKTRLGQKFLEDLQKNYEIPDSRVGSFYD